MRKANTMARPREFNPDKALKDIQKAY